MPQIIDIKLPPIEKGTSACSIFSNDPTVAIVSNLSGSMRKALSSLMLSPKWNSEKAPKILEQVLRNQLPLAIKTGARISTPIQKILGEEDIKRLAKSKLPSPNEIRLPPLNEQFIHDAFIRNKGVFTKLNDLSKIPTRGKNSELLLLLRSLSVALRSGHNNSLSNAFELVKDAFDKPEFTVPFEHTEYLGLLMFLPYNLRLSIQKTLLHNNSIDYLRHYAQKKDDASFIEARKSFEDLLRLDAFSPEHWERLILDKDYKASEDLVLQIGNRSLSLLAQIKEFCSLPSAADVIAAASESHEKRRFAIMNKLKEEKPTPFHAIDAGHFLQSPFRFLDYAKVSDKAKQRLQKDGRLAAIFEDDKEQAQSYRTLINGSSSFLSPDEASFTSDNADQILSLVDSAPKIGLFLIDIAQPDNQRAGLDLILKLLPKLAEKFSPHAQRENESGCLLVIPGAPKKETTDKSPFLSDGRPEEVSVILWSASRELADQAELAIEEFLKNNRKLSKLVDGPGSRAADARIEVKVELKAHTHFL